MQCYEEDVRLRESALLKLDRNEALDIQFKRAAMARLREEIQERRRAGRVAALTAANYYAATGDLARARVLIEVAAAEPEFVGEVAKVREYIGRLTARSSP
jgi:hypothetical protein